MDFRKIYNRFDLSTKKYIGLTEQLYAPFSKWPKLHYDVLKLDGLPKISLHELREEIASTKILEHAVNPRMTGKKSRRKYSLVGMTYNLGCENVVSDSAEYLDKEGKKNSSTFFANEITNRDMCRNLFDDYHPKLFLEENRYLSGGFKRTLSVLSPLRTKVRLAQLNPGGFLQSHFDCPYYKEIRIHLSIFSNPDVFYEIEGNIFQIPEDGNFYFFDAGKVHSVYNFGKTPRLVLTIQFRVNDAIISAVKNGDSKLLSRAILRNNLK